jgi:hypothetical protein
MGCRPPRDRALLKPGETYTRDTPNAWGVFSGDEKLGLVYVGTGNSPPDYYAAHRSKTADEFTDNVVAIDVATGQLRWFVPDSEPRPMGLRHRCPARSGRPARLSAGTAAAGEARPDLRA